MGFASEKITSTPSGASAYRSLGSMSLLLEPPRAWMPSPLPLSVLLMIVLWLAPSRWTPVVSSLARFSATRLPYESIRALPKRFMIDAPLSGRVGPK